MILFLGKIAHCISLPLLICLCISIGFQIKKRTNLVFIVLFSFLWRLFQGVKSSRYCVIFLVFSIVLITLNIKEQCLLSNKKKKTVVLLFLIVCINNTFCAFAGFRNNYIYDLKESALFFSKKNHSAIYIERKDAKRIASLKNEQYIYEIKNPQIMNNGLDFYYEQFAFWESDTYFYVYESNRTVASNYTENEVLLPKVGHLITNKSRSKVYSIYFQKKIIPKTYSELREQDSNITQRIIDKGSLKLYNSKYEVYIFQVNEILYWFIGHDLPPKTEIVFHLHTNRPDLLPPDRLKYLSDNQSFFEGSKYELPKCGRFRMFSKEIPQNYPITEVITGLKSGDNMDLFYVFNLSNK